MQKNTSSDNDTAVATFGSGCFWCTEAFFTDLKGVKSVTSGYMGGQRENPTYEQVCSGATGHAEVVQIEFYPDQISFTDLLEVFWATHDPTTLNQQGADRGTQYRSVVFYHDREQKEQAEEYKAQLDKSGAFDNAIVTEITEAQKFYPAEAYHQDYYGKEPNAPYCQFVIKPKLQKFRSRFGAKLQSRQL